MEPVMTRMPSSAVTMPAAVPIMGILEKASAMGASEAASSSSGIMPAAMVDRPAYSRITMPMQRIMTRGMVLCGSFTSPAM